MRNLQLAFKLKETILESSKSRLKLFKSDLSVKTFLNHTLKIPVLNRSDDVLEFKMMFSVEKWTSWEQWSSAITDLKQTFLMEIAKT